MGIWSKVQPASKVDLWNGSTTNVDDIHGNNLWYQRGSQVNDTQDTYYVGSMCKVDDTQDR